MSFGLLASRKAERTRSRGLQDAQKEWDVRARLCRQRLHYGVMPATSLDSLNGTEPVLQSLASSSAPSATCWRCVRCPAQSAHRKAWLEEMVRGGQASDDGDDLAQAVRGYEKHWARKLTLVRVWTLEAMCQDEEHDTCARLARCLVRGMVSPHAMALIWRMLNTSDSLERPM